MPSIIFSVSSIPSDSGPVMLEILLDISSTVAFSGQPFVSRSNSYKARSAISSASALCVPYASLAQLCSPVRRSRTMFLNIERTAFMSGAFWLPGKRASASITDSRSLPTTNSSPCIPLIPIWSRVSGLICLMVSLNSFSTAFFSPAVRFSTGFSSTGRASTKSDFKSLRAFTAFGSIPRKPATRSLMRPEASRSETICSSISVDSFSSFSRLALIFSYSVVFSCSSSDSVPRFSGVTLFNRLFTTAMRLSSSFFSSADAVFFCSFNSSANLFSCSPTEVVGPLNASLILATASSRTSFSLRVCTSSLPVSSIASLLASRSVAFERIDSSSVFLVPSMRCR